MAIIFPTALSLTTDLLLKTRRKPLMKDHTDDPVLTLKHNRRGQKLVH